MDKIKNPFKWLKAKNQLKYDKFLNSPDDLKPADQYKYQKLINDYQPRWQINKKFKNYSGNSIKKKQQKGSGRKRQKGKGHKVTKRKKNKK